MKSITKPTAALTGRPPSGGFSRTMPVRILAGFVPGLPALIVALLLFLGGPVACTTFSSLNAGDPYKGRSWDQIRAELINPDQIVQYLRVCSITYKGEKPGTLNHTQTPEETLRLKTGDCEDYAFLITDALINEGYDAKIISVEADRARKDLLIHAVAIYRDPSTNQWHYIHGYRFNGLSIGVSEGFDTETDVARTIAKKMGGKLYQYFVMSPDAFRSTYDVMRN